MSHVPVSEAARLIGHGCLPRHISDLIYAGKVPAQVCPIVGGRRMVPAAYLSEIRRLLRESGRINAPLACEEPAACG